MESNLSNPKALAQDLEVIKRTVKDGTALIQQLLTGARKNKAQFKLLSINRLIMTIPKWLESTLPKTITIDLALDPTDPQIEADASQLNQVLLNLCVNASDAMGDTGRLQLSTMLIAGNQLRDQFPRAEDRNYVCIAVKDTGLESMKTFGSICLSHSSQQNRKVRERGLGFRLFTASS